ncbi:MAG: Bax inhibitor-1/YccA family protein [Bacteroidales bacterium]
MRIGNSSNPMFSKNSLSRVYNTSTEGQMTINGTVNKMLIALFLVVVSAYFSWNYVLTGGNPSLLYVGAIGGFIVAIVTVFKAEWSHITTPIYSILEGLFLGGISALFSQVFNGIVFQAIFLTFGVAFAMLFAYKSGLIKATSGFKKGVIAATGGIAIFYLISIIAGLFGANISLANMGLLGIGIQLVIVVVAALNLVLDFDRIEQMAQQGAPKVMEWYGTFGILVTLIWLYLELLKLLAMIAGNRD